MFDIETICANSFRNFHTKGFDYLCISRTPELTRKVYFFDGDLAGLPELVVPHDHRYDFTTTVLSGCVKNLTYTRCASGTAEGRWAQQWFAEGPVPRFNLFEYMTPLNGGDGFKWVGEEVLIPDGGIKYIRGEHYRSSANDIHTLNIRCEGTVILLEQEADRVPLDKPTRAWQPSDTSSPWPSTAASGLYDRMTPDHARLRVEQFLDLIGNR